MALDWKVISQRNWLKGLQATFVRFSQPQGIITRLSNLLYDQRGGLRTNDGSLIFTERDGAPQPVDGPIMDLVLYAPQGQSPYYVGLQKTQLTQFGLVTGITLQAIEIGGPIATAVRANGTTTITLNAAAHNLHQHTAPLSQLVQSGISDASMNVTLTFNQVTILSADSYSYPDSGPASSATGGTLGTNMAPGTYQYDVTASDAQGGETPGSGLTSTVTLTAPDNAIIISWTAVPLALGYVIYGRTFTGVVWGGVLNGPGPAPDSLAVSLIYCDMGSNTPGGGLFPPQQTPTINTTSTTNFWLMTAPSYDTVLANLPGSLMPVTGGIPGATNQNGITIIVPGGSGAVLLTIDNIYTSGQQTVWEGPTLGNVTFYTTLTFVLTAPATPPLNFTVSGNTNPNFNTSFFNPRAINSTSFTVNFYSATNQTGDGGTAGTAGTATTSTTQQATAQGGVSGLLCPLPILLQFTNRIILALGNGYPPQQYLDPSAGGSLSITPINNIYSGEYTDWQASVAWSQGDIIHDSISGGLFQATNTGTSGTTRPNFNNTLNANTPELTPGTVVWTCIAVSSTGTPLRGGACAIVYAGALWLANTAPSTTSDELDGPCCIKMSDVNNVNSWNPSNVAFLARDDGDQITSLATYTIAEAGIAPTGSLVVFKNFSTFQITGVFGANDFTIQQAQTDMGNVAPRSVQFSPGFGIMRLTHLGFAYFQGVDDKLISEEIRPFLFGGEPDIAPVDWKFAYLSKAAQAAKPPLYICACPIVRPPLATVSISGSGAYLLFVRVVQLELNAAGTWDEIAATAEVEVGYDAIPQVTVYSPPAVAGIKYRIFAGYASGFYNQYLEAPSLAGLYFLDSFIPGFTSFGTGGLTRIFCYDLVMKQWAITDLPFPISALRQIRYPGSVPTTVAGGASDGALRRLYGDDVEWDTGDAVPWTFTGAEIFQQGGSAKIYFRRLVIRGHGNLGQAVTVSVNLQGVAQRSKTQVPRVLGGSQWELRIDIVADSENANATVSGSGPAQMTIESMDWYVKPKSPGAPVSIQG